ncbi:MAG: acyl-CoA dehydrogenase family protein [Deltaproteobacteria bacterium]|nr:acyl-CoA dehydrogenase family protein [Deltaproteobacteria bacterium]
MEKLMNIYDLLITIDNNHPIRNKIKNFLECNTPPDISPEKDLDQFVTDGSNWQKKLFDQKVIGNFVPTEYGGCNISFYDEAVALETLALEGSPQIPGIFGLTMLCPILLRNGSNNQKAIIPKLVSGEIIACQLFSEPSAGSDLSSLQTKLTKTIDGYILNGQKIWTSFAKYAQLGFGIARLDDAQPKKKSEGICFFLIDMKNQPNKAVMVKPIRQISGEAEFCEVFFDNAFVSNENIIGDPNQGWKIAIETLLIERALLTFARHTQTINLVKKIANIITKDFRKEFEHLISEFNLLRLVAYQNLEKLKQAPQNPDVWPGAESSADKLLWSENFKKFARFYRRLALKKDAATLRDAEKVYFYSLGRTIAAGTSEIQKLTIAQRLLGLPRSY